MSPYCQVTFGQKTYTTETSSGNQPKWNQEFKFDDLPSTPLFLIVYHKAMLFGKTEIGKCSIKLPVQAFESTKTFNLVNPNNENVGTILVSIAAQDLTPRLATTPSEELIPPPKYMQTHGSYGRLPKLSGSPEISASKNPPKTDDGHEELLNMKREVTEQNDCLKQQEERIKKSVDKIRYEQMIIKKHKSEVRQAQEGILYIREFVINE